MIARVLIVGAGLLAGAACPAGPLSIEPHLGVVGDYSSNPTLRADDSRAETHVAALVDAPIRYESDAWRFSLSPSARLSDSTGYASLASNFYHLDAGAQRYSERAVMGVTAGLARDSSLTYGGESNRGLGVRRDTRSAGLNWQQAPTERASLQLNAGWTRVTYGQGGALNNLNDYRYVYIAPSAGFALTERNTIKLLGSAGRYNSLNKLTASKDYNLQLGFDRQLSEMWTLSASAGFSRSNNRREIFFGPFYLGTSRSTQNSGVYNASLKRNSETLSVALSASRSLRPTGLAFLSRQDVGEAHVGYRYSERWSYSANASFVKSVDPLSDGRAFGRRYFAANMQADWYWTPETTVSLRVTRISQRFDVLAFNGDSSGVGLEFTRRFGRMSLGQ